MVNPLGNACDKRVGTDMRKKKNNALKVKTKQICESTTINNTKSAQHLHLNYSL